MSETTGKRTPDQWKDYGDCMICRRKGYCGSVCKARRRFLYLWKKVLTGRAGNDKSI